MPLNRIETEQLASFLGDLSEMQGNAGCNDWSIPATPENIEWINDVQHYGVDNNLWDEDSKPSITPSEIIWMDFMIVAYLQHKILNQPS